MVTRSLAVGSIAGTGVALAGGGVASLDGASGAIASVLAVLGVALGAALVAGSVLLYRSDVRTVVGAGVSLPLYVVDDVLGVSSVAHVLIGYNDVRRIRAEELARQRRTLAERIRDGNVVTVSVHDRGPGVPDEEVAVLTGEREISQLEHASGLGLWVVKTVAETYDGDLDFDRTEDGGVVSLSLPRAS